MAGFLVAVRVRIGYLEYVGSGCSLKAVSGRTNLLVAVDERTAFFVAVGVRSSFLNDVVVRTSFT